jgi:hypothetical protein
MQRNTVYNNQTASYIITYSSAVQIHLVKIFLPLQITTYKPSLCVATENSSGNSTYSETKIW